MSRFAIQPPRSMASAQTITRSRMLLASGSGLARHVAGPGPEQAGGHRAGDESDTPVAPRISASWVVHGRLEGQGPCHGTADAGERVSAFRVPLRMVVPRRREKKRPAEN